MTLTQAAIFTKRGMIAFVVIIFLGVCALLGWRYYYNNIYLPNLPKPEIKPDTKFGVLPKLRLPEASASASNFSYVLDTPTGNLPEKLPILMKVYFSPPLGTTLLALDRATKIASNLEFTNGPKVISPTQYKFLDKDGGELVVDLTTSNFSFQRAAYKDFTPTSFSDDKKIADEFVAFLTKNELLREELRGGRTIVVYPTVSIWPKDLDKYPIINEEFNKSLIQAIVGAGKSDYEKYLKMDYTFWPIDQTTISTYPIKSIKQAYESLKSGEAAVLKDPKTSKVSLRSIYLAYYQTKLYQPYVQPIYVFEGEGFLALVPAISEQFSE